MSELGEAIRTFRERNGITLAEMGRLIAQRLHMARPIPKNTVWRWEKGDMRVHSYIAGFICQEILVRCDPADLLVREPAPRETFAASIARRATAVHPGSASLGGPHATDPASEAEGLALLRQLPRTTLREASDVTPAGPYAL